MKSILIAVALLPLWAAFAQRDVPFANTRIFPSAVTQTEPVAAVDPANPLVMFASAKTINTRNGFVSEGVYVTTNGGLSWTGSDTCTGDFIGNHMGSPGVAIHPGGRFVLEHIGSLFPGIYSHYSTDRGATWSDAAVITSDQPEDKGTLAIDDRPESPFYGRLYASWATYLQPFSAMISYSADSGTSWTTPFAVNGAPPEVSSGGSVKTGLNGEVYVCWAGLADASPFQPTIVGFASSTDGASPGPSRRTPSR